MLKTYKEKGEFSLAPGAVPVINFSDDDELEEITKNNARDLLDQDEDYDELEDIDTFHKRSSSDTNFESLFNHPRNGYRKDHDDSSCSRNSGQQADKDTNENDFKIFMYLEDKNETGDEVHESPEFTAKEKPVQVEKRLDNLFKREVPLSNIYFEKESEQTVSTVKVPTPDQSTSYFPADLGSFSLFRTKLDQR